jgi:hypothetical protein
MKFWSILSVFFALCAAFFWAWSTKVNLPLLKSGWGTLVTEMEDGSTVNSEAPFYKALARISRLNAVAAWFAFLSASTQAVTLFLRS